MTDNEYLTLAEAALSAIESTIETAINASDVEIDIERNGDVLTLEFANRSKIIVNLQKPLHEIWVAAKAGGFHYRYKDSAWLNTRDNTELFAALSQYASEQAQQTIKLSSF